MVLLVVDASHWQEDIDASALKAAGVVGCIHKCTEIMRYKGPEDEYYGGNKARCLDAGLLWGGYLYIDPTDGKAQADFYLDTIKPDGQTLLAIDVEEGGITLKQVEDAILRIYERTGVYPLFYSSYAVIQRIGGLDSKVIELCRLWLAGKPPRLPMMWSEYTLLQFDYLNVGPKTFDLNNFNGTFDELKEVWKMTSPVAGLVQAKLKAANSVPIFTTSGGPLWGWGNPGDPITVLPGSEQTINGVTYIDTPDDHRIRVDYIDGDIPTVPPPPPPPPPVSKQMVTTAALNMRQQPAITAAVLVTIPQGGTVTVTGTPDTTQYKWVSATAVVSGRTFSGFVSSPFLKSPQ